MQGQVFERLHVPMPVRPSYSFLAVLGCLLLALLHLFCQSAHLSTPPALRRFPLNDPTLPQPNPHYDALLQLAKETQIPSLPVNSISMNNLQMFDSEDNVPASTDNLISTPTQIFRALDVAIAEKQLPYKGIEASIIKQVKVSKLILSNYNAGSEEIDMHLPHAENRNVAPNSEDELAACERLVHMNQNAESHHISKCAAEADNQKVINAEQNKKFSHHFVTMLSQASSQKLGRKVKVQTESVKEKEDPKQEDNKPTTKFTELKEGPTQAELQMPKLELSEKMLDVQASKNNEFKDHELVITPPQQSDYLIKEPIEPLEHASLQPSINSTAKERLDWLKDNWDQINILYTDDHAKEFSTRIDNFLAANNTGADACELRFFMTWIAPLSAFSPREKLALESVFKSHPSACIVILSQTLDTPKGHLILGHLSGRGFKVLAITPDIPFLLQSTPAEKWFKDLKEGLIDPGIISINQNLSNLLRLAVLYKYGGVYIDNDVIVMKSFANFSNVIGAQNIDQETGKWNRLNNAVMVFEKESPLLLRFIEEFSLTFNGSKWGHNGPYLVSRVVRKKPNWGCKVMDPLAFYPVDWDHIGGFFRAPRNSVEKQWVVAKMAQLIQHSFSIHLWNKLSRSMDVEPGSIMDSIFQRFCILCDHLHTDDNTVLKLHT